MAGLTDQGLEIKRLNEVIADLKSRAQPIFQDLVRPGDVVDTSDSSTIGRLIALESVPIADLWEAVQQVYLAFDPNSATGIALDNLVAIGGVTRRPESRTTADVYLTGNSGSTIPIGMSVRSPTTSMTYSLLGDVKLDKETCHGVGIVLSAIQPSAKYSVFYKLADTTVYSEVSTNTALFPTIEGIYEDLEQKIANNHPMLRTRRVDGVLFVEGAVEMQLLSFYTSLNMNITKVIGIGRVQADESGAYEQAPNSINIVATPMLGWDAVTNPVTAITGSARETDAELRVRFRETKFQRSTNIIEALYSALYSVAGVTTVIIYENDTDNVDENGILPHSFLTLVDGGLDTDIAKAIWLNRPAGIRSMGNTPVNIIDSFGYVRNINFSRPEPVEVFVRMALVTDQDFPPDGVDQIKKNLVDYVSSLTISEDVVYSRLYTPINKVRGHQVNNLEISTDGVNWQTTNIEVGLTEKAKLVANNITVT